MEPLDLQLNGYKGVDFNDDALTGRQLHDACAAVRADGGGRMLATVITDRLDRMVSRISRLAVLRAADQLATEVVAGIHIEGPFLSPLPGYIGAHPAEYVLPATVEAAKQLVAAGQGLVRLVTLAPEHDAALATTRWLAGQGICVSAGHANPSAEILEQAIDAGLSAWTHLGNGCPLNLHRHDNILWRVLAADRLRWIMLIADGVHLPPSLIRTIIRVVGVSRVIAVSDATAAGGMGPGRFALAGQEVVVDESGAAWAVDRSHLVGSTAAPFRLREVLQELVGLSGGEVDQLMTSNPEHLLGESAGGEQGGSQVD